MKGKFNYVNGITISVARTLFKFIFRDFFLKAEKNEKELRYEIYLRDKIKQSGEIILLEEIVDIDWFNLFWNRGNFDNPVFKLNILRVDTPSLTEIS